MLRRFSLLLSFVAVLTSAVIPLVCVRAHEASYPELADLSGIYELKDFAAAGIYSSGEEDEARDFIGYFLTVHGDHIVLPTSELCHVASVRHETLKDDWESFGTAGGSWSEVGLIETSAAGYDVTLVDFDCDGPFGGMIVQPESQTYLLKYWAVYLMIGREQD
ncbi:hypothetical protein HH303_16755 [Rhodospirillaceae bacterium KN72]|uniref:Uncharacterized protein n=1 Tax=Pacificispira spongiicola TaxID=2729598 RepID=A0A7Y0HFS4_9PROT|nr:hypothetical protein [Pacificispira spongiicola]NMM46145.1 hypothetical protein [Pacificispira spongiicola]